MKYRTTAVASSPFPTVLASVTAAKVRIGPRSRSIPTYRSPRPSHGNANTAAGPTVIATKNPGPAVPPDPDAIRTTLHR